MVPPKVPDYCSFIGREEEEEDNKAIYKVSYLLLPT